jgi:hypothetical protein
VSALLALRLLPGGRRRRRVELPDLLLRLFEQLQRDLQLATATFELLELGALARQHRDQMFELRLLQPRHLAQPLDVLLSLDVEHARTRSCSI